MTRFDLDLLRIPLLGRVLRRREFPLVFQMASLAALVGLAAIGWGVGVGASPKELLVLRKTNLTTLFVWGLWWPAMIVFAILVGRLWCTVCPMELVNRVGEALARRLGLPRLRISRWLRAGWMVLVAYVVLQLLVAGASIHRVPHYTAILLLALLGTALLTGVLFSDTRSFCKSFCPATALLSVYGRRTRLQLDVHDVAACSGCKTRDCVAEGNRFKLDGRSCPSRLAPFARQPSDGCVSCLQCAKACPTSNVGLGILSESAAGERRGALLKPFEALFVVVATGFVTHEVMGEVKWVEALFHRPAEAMQRLSLSISFAWFEAAWFLVVFPALVWAAIALAAQILGYRGGLRHLVITGATAAAPVLAIAHLAKALAKLTSWGGYAVLAARDPSGERAARAILDGQLAAPAAFVNVSVLGWCIAAGLAWTAWRAAQGASLPDRASLPAARAAVAVTGSLFAAVLVAWIRA